ncbi:hypothetical protein [Oceaniglobus ichthyenteri]|uniref:hypothetical protein n=1 Tax=Oceaniglobus ichthyenteri TaxID=2136177 RepID=UPI000D3491A7|nr:hypothetical protein [Oceaniglobus ichthyenteri]
MTRRLIAAVVSVGIALGTLAPAPAQAGNRDLEKLLGGIATVVILGATYDHFRDKRKRRKQTHAERPRNHKIVPSQCLRILQTRNGTRRIFTNRCLQRNMTNVHRLPQECWVRVRTDEGPRQGYGARCLNKRGWQHG